MSDSAPRSGLSPTFKFFLAGLFFGFVLAAAGEGTAVSPGTMIGAFLGGLIGLGVGLTRAIVVRVGAARSKRAPPEGTNHPEQ